MCPFNTKCLTSIFPFPFPQANCSRLSEYLQGPLGRYLLNVSSSAEQCSDMLCHSHGRCLRRQPDTDTYLHLNPSSHSITLQDRRWKVIGKAGRTELADFRTHFQCQCYSGYRGEGCGLKEKEENRASSCLGAWPSLLIPLGLLTLLH